MRKATLVHTAIWDDDAFLELGADAQLVYLYFLTQPTVSTVGRLVMRPRWWAQRLFGVQERLDAALVVLEAGGFVWVDDVTEELIIRSWIRHNVQGKPNMEKAARDVFSTITSATLKNRMVDAYPTLFEGLVKPTRNPPETHPGGFPEKVREHVTRYPLPVVSGPVVEIERARARNEDWDALVSVFGYSPTDASERSLWGKLSGQLGKMKTEGLIGDWLAEAARRYRADMNGVPMTPPALIKHAPRLMAMREADLPERKRTAGQLIAKIREDIA